MGKKDWKAPKIHEEIQTALLFTTVHKCLAELKHGYESLEDDHCAVVG